MGVHHICHPNQLNTLKIIKQHSRIIFGLLHSCNEIHILQVLHGFFVEIPRTEVQNREQCEWEVVGYKCFVIPFILEEDVPTGEDADEKC